MAGNKRTNGIWTGSSKFASACAACGGWMAEGSRINYDRAAKRASHVECPATPQAAPVRVMVDVAPKRAELEQRIAELRAEYLTAQAAHEPNVHALGTAIDALKLCHCDGSGNIHLGHDSDYDCGGSAYGHMTRAGALELPQIAPLAAAHAVTKAPLDRITAAGQRAKEELAALLVVRKGDRVVVARGRKVPVGTIGIAAWIGDSAYGERVGLSVECEEKLVYTALKNVDALAHRITMPAEQAQAEGHAVVAQRAKPAPKDAFMDREIARRHAEEVAS